MDQSNLSSSGGPLDQPVGQNKPGPTSNSTQSSSNPSGVQHFALPTETEIAAVSQGSQKLEENKEEPSPTASKVGPIPIKEIKEEVKRPAEPIPPPVKHVMPPPKPSVPPKPAVPPRVTPPPTVAKPVKVKSRKSCGKAVLVILFIVIFSVSSLLAGTYFGYEVPYVSDYIAKYLRIFSPKNFSRVRTAAIEATKRDRNYNLLLRLQVGQEGVVNAVNKQSNTNGPPPLPGSSELSSSQSLPIYQNMNLYVLASRDDNGIISGTVHISPLTNGNKTSSFDQNMDIVIDQQNAYFLPESVLADKPTWQKVSLTEVKKNKVFSILLDAQDAGLLVERIEEAQWSRAGLTDIKDQADKVLASYSINSYIIQKVGQSAVDLDDFDLEIALTKWEYYPVKLSAAGPLGRGLVMRMANHYFGFGTVSDLTSKIPNDEQCESLSFSEFLVKNGLSGQVAPVDDPEKAEMSKRDAIRQADLSSIAAALEEYKKDNGLYPVSPEVEKTNNSTILKSALVPKYLSALPVDPKDPEYWYGYDSDGYHFNLTSVVEHLDTPGLQGQRVRYQERKE